MLSSSIHLLHGHFAAAGLAYDTHREKGHMAHASPGAANVNAATRLRPASAIERWYGNRKSDTRAAKTQQMQPLSHVYMSR